MENYNKYIVLGYVGIEPEVKVFDNGAKKVRVRVATTRRGYTNKAGQEIPDRTEWHNVVLFGQKADYAAEHTKKGDLVLTEGEIHYETYEKNGEKRTATELWADSFKCLQHAKSDGQEAASATDAEGAGVSPADMRRVFDGMTGTQAQAPDNDLPF